MPVCTIMRGLVACGKSHRARRLVGKDGLVCEVDEYFYTQVGKDNPKRYDYNTKLVRDARRWNYCRFKAAIRQGVSPVIVDRGHSKKSSARKYARYAFEHGYEIKVAEPDSPWWIVIRELLKNKEQNLEKLKSISETLSKLSRKIHRVSSKKIYKRMLRWDNDVTPEEILGYKHTPVLLWKASMQTQAKAQKKPSVKAAKALTTTTSK